MSVVQEVVNYFASRLTLVHVWNFGEHCNLLQIQHVQGVRLKNLASNQWGGMYTVEKWEFPFIPTSCIATLLLCNVHVHDCVNLFL